MCWALEIERYASSPALRSLGSPEGSRWSHGDGITVRGLPRDIQRRRNSPAWAGEEAPGKTPRTRYMTHSSSGQEMDVVGSDGQMCVRLQRRQKLLLPGGMTAQSGSCRLKSLSAESCCMRPSQLAWKILVFSICQKRSSHFCSSPSPFLR